MRDRQNRLKINLAKSAGFCFGVKRAIELAFKIASSGKKVCMLGDIVHNEKVAEQIRKAGVKKITKLSPAKGRILLIRAHGIGADVIRRASGLGYKIIDATCPMVREIHKIAVDMEKARRKIIVIGDKEHDEVRGIVGQLKAKPLVIDGVNNIPGSIKKIKRAGVVIQSTQNMDEALKIMRKLKKTIPDLKFVNTVCRPTRIKQREIKIMPAQNDVMIIIGSKNSANTRRLYEIAKSLNRRSYWVNAKEEIKPEWLGGAKKVGVTAGASTPASTIREIVEYLSSINA